MRHRYLCTLPLLLLAFTAGGTVTAEPIAFVDEDQFLAAAAALGWSLVQKSFEDDIYWGSVRPSIVNGVYSYPHGSYGAPDPETDCYVPGECGDGFRGRPEIGMLRAVGGWVRTNTPYDKHLALGHRYDQPNQIVA